MITLEYVKMLYAADDIVGLKDVAMFFNDTATTEIYTGEDTLSLHDELCRELEARMIETADKVFGNVLIDADVVGDEEEEGGHPGDSPKSQISHANAVARRASRISRPIKSQKGGDGRSYRQLRRDVESCEDEEINDSRDNKRAKAFRKGDFSGRQHQKAVNYTGRQQKNDDNHSRKAASSSKDLWHRSKSIMRGKK